MSFRDQDEQEELYHRNRGYHKYIDGLPSSAPPKDPPPFWKAPHEEVERPSRDKPRWRGDLQAKGPC